MKLVIVEKIPEKKFEKPFHKNVSSLLEKFSNSDAKAARVDTDPGEYASSESVANVVDQAIRRSGLNLKVCKRGPDIYVKRM